MASAPRDNNRVPVKMATSSVDGISPMLLYATNNLLLVDDNTTGSNLPFVNAKRDDNRVPVMWATSSTDGTTPIPIYATSNKLLVNSQ